MIIIDYRKKNHNAIIRAAVEALKAGKSVVYPTDTCYGLAVDATNSQAILKVYNAIKIRDIRRPLPLAVPSAAAAKKIVLWDKTANLLAKKFWPGALTLVLPVRNSRSRALRLVSAGTKFIGVRMPKNRIALDLAGRLGKPIVATSANVSGQPEPYSVEDIIGQFNHKQHKPDIIINAGRLPRRKPSTIVKIQDSSAEVLREGPISAARINRYIKIKP